MRDREVARAVPDARSIADEVARKVSACDDAELETLLAATRGALAATGPDARDIAEGLMNNASLPQEQVSRVINTEKRLRYYVRLKEILRRIRNSGRSEAELELLGVRP